MTTPTNREELIRMRTQTMVQVMKDKDQVLLRCLFERLRATLSDLINYGPDRAGAEFIPKEQMRAVVAAAADQSACPECVLEARRQAERPQPSKTKRGDWQWTNHR